MQNPPACHSGRSAHNSRSPDIPRNRQTDARQFPSALHAYSPCVLHSQSGPEPARGNCKNPAHPLRADASSSYPDVLHRWKSDSDPAQIFPAQSSMCCRTSGSLKCPRSSMRYPDEIPQNSQTDLPYTASVHFGFRSETCTAPLLRCLVQTIHRCQADPCGSSCVRSHPIH